MFNDANATPEKGKKVIYKDKFGNKIQTKIIRVDRSRVILKKISEE